MFDILVCFLSAIAVLFLFAAYLLLLLSVLSHSDRKDNQKDESDN